MPIPPKRRAADKREALIVMVEIMGDSELTTSRFSPTQIEFESLAPTTWRELVAEGFIEDRGEKPGPLFRMTADGWLKGLEISAAIDSDETRERAIKIRRALKERVNRNQFHDSYVDVRTLAEEIGVPVGWVFNVISANLLERLFPHHMMTVEFRRLLIVIPSTFDMVRE
jgi:hypothetical protein